jgi:hypothetical protein
MSRLTLAALASLLLASVAARAQQPAPAPQSDDDDEDELARRDWAARQQQVYPQATPQPGYPAPDPRGYYVPPTQDYAQPVDPYGYVDANAPQYGYVGPHPIPYDFGSGFCYEQGAHFHEYPPFDSYLFRESGGYFYFIGDVGDFGYSQQVWGYNGNHPIPLMYGGGYCYIGWPHRHHFAPAVGVSFNFVGGYYVYAGPWDPFYFAYRDNYYRYYNGYYRSNYFGGVYYTVRPAPLYRPALVVGAPGVYRPGVVVAAPGGGRVTVAPAASAGVRVGAPPAPGVRVGAPAAPYRMAAPPAYHAAPAGAYRAPPPAYHAAPPAYRAAPAPSYNPPRRYTAPVHSGSSGFHHR